MDGISSSRGCDKEISHGVLLMEQLVLSDKWARKFYLTNPYQPMGKIKNEQPHNGHTLSANRSVMSMLC